MSIRQIWQVIKTKDFFSIEVIILSSCWLKSNS